MFEDYKAFKEKVGVDDVATYLGYKLDRKAGVGKYVEYNIRDGRGRKIDSIVISHPSDKSSQTYFHRNGASGGDAISLIKANINSFGVTGSSEAEMLAAVMSKLTCDDTFIAKAEDRYKDMKPQTFDIKRFQMENAAEHFEAVMSFFRARSIDEETVRTFLPFIMRVTDTEAQYKYKDLAFPYTKPGSEKIEGFELRGYNNFRQKAPGTNSSSAAWIADFTKEQPDRSATTGDACLSKNAKNVYFFESGYDAMAFYQVNKSRLILETSVFVSTGGTFSSQQIKGITDYYPQARYWDCFDNDIPGILYGVRMESQLSGQFVNIVTTDDTIIFQKGADELRLKKEEVTLPKVREKLGLERHIYVWKAPKAFKDWNDVTMNKPMKDLPIKSKYQRNENLREKRRKGTL